jgi:hypothetical protein
MEICPMKQSEIIESYPLFQEIDFTDMTPETCMGRCLTGQYRCFAGKEGDDILGLVALYFRDTTAFVVALSGKNSLKKGMPVFIDMLRKLGVKAIRGETKHNEAAYSRLFGMEKIYSTFERVL